MGLPALLDNSSYYDLGRGYQRATLLADGMWSWFNDPHAIYQQTPAGVNRMHVGVVTSTGDVRMLSKNLDTGASTSSTLKAALQVDDHNPPAMVIMPDGTIFATYSKHNLGPIYYRRTTDPEDPTSWGTEATLQGTLGGGTNLTYPKPVRFASNGRLYIIYRGHDGRSGYWYSDNDGGAWSGPLDLIDLDPDRPYLNINYNQALDKLDILFTDGHPRTRATSMYHVTMEGNSDIRHTDGTLIRNSITSGVVVATEGTVIYQYQPQLGRSWGWDIAREPWDTSKIVAVFVRYEDDDQDRHHYAYARWNGSYWTVNRDVLGESVGPSFYGAGGPGSLEPHYTGGIALVQEDPRVVYLSRTGDQNTAKWDIERWGPVATESYDTLPTAASAMGFWPLGDQGGDDLAGANDATLVNSPATVTGLIDSSPAQATQLVAASSQEVTLPITTTGENFAFELIFTWSSGTAIARDNTTSGGFIMGFDSAGSFRVRVTGISGDLVTTKATADVRNGQRHHFVINKLGTIVTVVLDGEVIGTAQNANLLPSPAPATPWHIGRNGATVGQYSDMTVQKAAFYPTALDWDTIHAHYVAMRDVRVFPPATRQPMTSFSTVKDIRPTSPRYPENIDTPRDERPEAVWLSGSYTSYIQYNTAVVEAGEALVPHETDEALPLTMVHVRTLGVATETDEALTLDWDVVGNTLGVASETDEALPLTMVHVRTLGVATETDSARPLALTYMRALGIAAETDSARPLALTYTRALGLATEADSARPLALTYTRILGVASEADSARPLTLTHQRALGLATETDTAVQLQLVGPQFMALGIATEADSAQALSLTYQRTLGVATELDAALALISGALAPPDLNSPLDFDLLDYVGAFVFADPGNAMAVASGPGNSMAIASSAHGGAIMESVTDLALTPAASTMELED
jgi:hypothetical protein